MRLLIAEDEKDLAEALTVFFEKNNFSADAVYDGQDAYDYAISGGYDAIILDIMMPNIDGWEVCRKIRETSSVPIIMLTARNQEFDELTGFDAGADDYVTKPCSPSVLMKRVAALLKRENAVNNSNVYTLDNLKLDASAHEVRLDGKPVTLTLKEYSILLKFLTAQSRVFSREQLLDDIWGYDFDGDMRTVDSHVARLRTKLGEWGSKHIKTIYGTGYKIEGD